MSTDQRERRVATDAVPIVTVFLVLLFAIPSVYIVASLGANVGAPASIVGLGMFALWLASRMHPRSTLDRGGQPLRYALFAFLSAVLISYALAASGGTLTPEALRSADRGVVYLVALLGVALLVADGIHTLERLTLLLRRLVDIATVMAAVGVIEYVTKANFITPIFDAIPLLHQNRFVAFAGGQTALSDLRRVTGTAVHAIEFGVVLAMVLPIALLFAVLDREHRGWRRWWKVALLAMAEPMAQSRSGLLVVIVSLVIFVPALPRPERRRLLGWAPVLVVSMRLVFPGLVGTIRNLFVDYADDPSYTYRQAHARQVGAFIAQHPWFGRGFMTWDPTHLFVLDNQYLLSTVETGYVGLVAFVAILLTGAGLALQAHRWAATPEERLLAMALLASIVGSAVAFATFDFLTFPMAISTYFVLLGSAGAAWRILRREAMAAGRAQPADRTRRHSGIVTTLG